MTTLHGHAGGSAPSTAARTAPASWRSVAKLVWEIAKGIASIAAIVAIIVSTYRNGLSGTGRIIATAVYTVGHRLGFSMTEVEQDLYGASGDAVAADARPQDDASAVLVDRVRRCRKTMPDRCPMPVWLNQANPGAHAAPVDLTVEEATVDQAETTVSLLSLAPDDRMMMEYLWGDLSADSARVVERRFDVDTTYRNRVWPLVVLWTFQTKYPAADAPWDGSTRPKSN